MTARSTEEWRGATPDSTIPPRVRLRLFERSSGRCQSCTRKIAPGDSWQADHVVALVNGGANAESNLQVLCGWCHKAKTAGDVAEKASTARIRAKHLGIKKRSTFACSRDSKWKKKLDGTVVPR